MTSAWRGAARHLPAGLLLAYLTVVLAGVMFENEGVPERDGFFHARYAQMLPDRGLSREFPWTQFSVWKDHFADKDFLYHVTLAPFCRDVREPLPGAKVATVLLAAATLTAMYLVLVSLDVPWPVFWAALLASGSGLFLSRLLMVRSHVLAILLMLLAALAVLRARWRTCAVLGFVCAWAYSFPLVLTYTVGAGALGLALVGERRVAWRVLAASAAGVGAGLLVHPYSPGVLVTLWVHVQAALGSALGGPVELAAELAGLSPMQMLGQAPGAVAALAVAVIGTIVLGRRRPGEGGLSVEAAAAVAMALAWAAGPFLAQRTAEYFVPLVVLAAALVVRDLVAGRETSPWRLPAGRPRVALLGTLAVITGALAASHQLALTQVHELVRTNPPFPSSETWRRNRFFDGAAAWLGANLPSGSTVVNLWWDDFPELYYSLPGMHYLVGLEPNFLRLADPARSEVLEAMRTRRIPLDLARLGELFGAEAMVLRTDRALLYDELQQGRTPPAFLDPLAVVYRLRPAPSQIPGAAYSRRNLMPPVSRAPKL